MDQFVGRIKFHRGTYLLQEALNGAEHNGPEDDAISAGSAVRGAFADLVACGAVPVALGTLVQFGHAVEPFAAEHSLPLEALARLDLNIWKPTARPLCAAHIPVEKVSDAA